MKIGILGAGISGLSCGVKLKEYGFDDITIFEKEQQIGGQTRSEVINGYVFDLHGGHVFNSKYDEIKDWVFSLFPENQWKYQPRNSQILYNNKIISYPFEYSLLELDQNETIECLVGFLTQKNSKEPDNFYDWLKWKFGDSIAHKYMIPYNEKIWAYDLRKMSVDWIKDKMPIPTIDQIVSSIIKKDFKEKDMPHASFYYPLNGGIQALTYAISRNVKKNIKTDYEIEHIEKSNRKFIINGEYKFDLIISTINIKNVVKCIHNTASAVSRAASLLIDLPLTITICKCRPNDISWLYLPDKMIKSHRIVFQGNFSPNNCPGSNMSSAVIETTGNIDPEDQLKDIRKIGLLKHLEIHDIISSARTNGYILYDKHHRKNLKVVNDFFDRYGIFRAGRFAERRYYNMDICIKRAFEVAEEIFKECNK